MDQIISETEVSQEKRAPEEQAIPAQASDSIQEDDHQLATSKSNPGAVPKIKDEESIEIKLCAAPSRKARYDDTREDKPEEPKTLRNPQATEMEDAIPLEPEMQQSAAPKLMMAAPSRRRY